MYLRYSKQRELILDCLRNTNVHPTAEWVYSEVKKELSDISLGTVYRNLKQLQENGFIRKVTIDDTVEHFDADTSNHYHFVCRKCNQVVDVSVDGQVKLKDDFNVEFVDVQFYGICNKCKEQEDIKNG